MAPPDSSNPDSNPGRAYFEADAFGQHLGFELIEVGPGMARVRLPQVPPWGRNGLGTPHGALLFALADVAFASAVNEHERSSIGIQTSISYVAAAAPGPIEARAREVARSRKLATYRVDVVDAAGTLVAAFSGTAYTR